MRNPCGLRLCVSDRDLFDLKGITLTSLLSYSVVKEPTSIAKIDAEYESGLPLRPHRPASRLPPPALMLTTRNHLLFQRFAADFASWSLPPGLAANLKEPLLISPARARFRVAAFSSAGIEC